MKKILPLILAVIIVCLSYSSVAEDLSQYSLEDLHQLYYDVVKEILERSSTVSSHTPTAEQEILFRDIPWGTNGRDFVTILKEKGINGGLKMDNISSWERLPFNGYLMHAKALDNGGYVYSSQPKQLLVAGYNVKEITAYFLLSHDSDTVSDTEDASELYFASYELDVMDKAVAYENLLNKLTGLYGTPEILNNSEHNVSSTTYCDQAFWYGANNTGLMLYRYCRVSDSEGEITYDVLELDYGITNSVSLINDLEAAMKREELELTTTSDSIDGL